MTTSALATQRQIEKFVTGLRAEQRLFPDLYAAKLAASLTHTTTKRAARNVLRRPAPNTNRYAKRHPTR